MLDALRQDVRFALRSLRRSPGFTFVAALTLAVSIGGNTALFSLLNAVAFRALPVPHPDRLVAISVVDDKGQTQPLIYQSTFEALRARQGVFETMALYSGGGLLATTVRGPLVDGTVESATPEYHAMLGVRPLAGRLLLASDSPPDGNAAPVVVIGARFSRQHFDGDAAAIGQRIVVSGVPLTVIGVTPPGFHGLQVDGGADFLVPLGILRQIAGDPRLPVRGWNIIARLRPGVSIEQARAEIAALWPSIQEVTLPPGLSAAGQRQMRALLPKVQGAATGFSTLRLRYANPLTILVLLAAALLAIGCANLGGLLLSRAAARDQEVAVCLALGATRARLIQRVAVESLLLSVAATALAVGLGWWGSQALARTLIGAQTRPLAMSVTPDATVLAAAALTAVALGLIVSILPAWLTTRSRAGIGLRSSRGVAAGIGRSGRAVLVGQIAASMILLVGALLFARSLARLHDNASAFPERRIAFGRLWLKPGVRTPVLDAAYFMELERQLSLRVAVEAVGFSMVFPASFNFTSRLETIARGDIPDGSSDITVIPETVSPRFFETVGITRLRGRDFTWQDDARSRPVAIVNSTLASRLFLGGDALGRTIRLAAGCGAPPAEIVGIVADAPIGNLREPATPVVFRPILQEPQRARVPIISVRSRSDLKAPRSASTVFSPMASRAAGARSACGWRWGRRADRSSA